MREMSGMTGFIPEDIISTLHALNLLRYWRGQHIVAISAEVLELHLPSNPKRKPLLCDMDKLQWPVDWEAGPTTGDNAATSSTSSSSAAAAAAAAAYDGTQLTPHL